MPIKYGIYSVNFRGGHASVRLHRTAYRELKSYFLELATHRSVDRLRYEFWNLENIQPYAPVRRQLFNILREVNRLRKKSGLMPVPTTCVRLKRKQVQVFVGEMPVAKYFQQPNNRNDWRVRDAGEPNNKNRRTYVAGASAAAITQGEIQGYVSESVGRGCGGQDRYYGRVLPQTNERRRIS